MFWALILRGLFQNKNMDLSGENASAGRDLRKNIYFYFLALYFFTSSMDKNANAKQGR